MQSISTRTLGTPGLAIHGECDPAFQAVRDEFERYYTPKGQEGKALKAVDADVARARERRDVGPVDWMPLLRCARDLAERLDTARPRTPGEDGPAQQGKARAVKLEAVA